MTKMRKKKNQLVWMHVTVKGDLHFHEEKTGETYLSLLALAAFFVYSDLGPWVACRVYMLPQQSVWEARDARASWESTSWALHA